MAIVKVSKKAENDLVEIGEYTENNWGIDKRNQYLDEIDQRFHLQEMVPRGGIEPPTRGFSVLCSTD